MSRINKKAGLSTLQTIIIILLIFVVLLIFYQDLRATLLKKSNREICRATALAQSVAVWAPEGENLVSLECKTYKVVFFEDHVEINDEIIEVYDPRKKDVVKKFNGLTEDIVNWVIAEELRWCWWQFLEGKKSLLNMKNFFGSAERTCFLCTEITFDESVKTDEFKNFFKYTKEKTMPNSEMTYYQYYAEEPRKCIWRYEEIIDADNCWEAYAQGISPNIITSTVQHFKEAFSHCSGIIPALSTYWSSVTHYSVVKNITFEKDKKYAVTFVREGATSRHLELEKLVKGETDCFFETYFSYVIPSDELGKHCGPVRRGSMK
ncbi:hypothetical protein KY348_00450 [Candidatus Woesearchaeota archaeon]|nr:hypothetical protein [Candidatus Woesearchaeota archaeon]